MPAMRRAVRTGASVSLEEIEVPAPEAGWALVRVRSCGICGSDLHGFRGGAVPATAPPVCPGHEIAGDVAETGAGVSAFAAGDRVAVEPLIVCRECSYCRTGEYQVCPRRRLLGTPGTPGGLADYVHVPAYTLYRLPEGLDYSVAALAEPLAVCVHGLRVAGLRAGDRVAVLGGGSLGLMAAAAARALGAGEVIVSARHDHQRRAALAAGALRAVEATAEAHAALGAAARTEPIDVVVEAVGGAADTVAQAIGLVRPAGAVAVLGVFTAPVPVNFTPMVLKEVRVTGSIMYGRSTARSDFGLALSLLASDAERFEALVSHTFSLDDAARAFEAALDKSSRSVKVQVRP